MKSRAFFILVVMSSISIGGVIGFYGGSQFAKKRIDSYYSQVQFKGIATELKTYVRVLELLRKNDVESGIELLEKFTDVELASLSTYSNTPIKERDEEVIATIRAVKDYRKIYSEHNVHSILSGDVQRALDLVVEK